MLVSIITPTYNSDRFISMTINSILAQTYKDWELIIVDDFSSDNTVSIVQNFIESDSRIKLIQLSLNSGAAVARNLAIRASMGRYIAFLDSDDVWFPQKLETQIKFMQRNNCPLSFAAYIKINESGDVIGEVGVPSRVDYKNLLKTCVIGCLTAVYDTHYFGKTTMPLIRKRQDFGLWLKLLKKTEFAYGIQEPLGQYRVRTDSISSNKANIVSSIWCLYREVEELSFLRSLYYFSQYALRGVVRKKLPKIAKYFGIL